MSGRDSVSEGLEHLAALVGGVQPGPEALVREVLALVASSLDADAVFVAGFDGGFHVERLHDRKRAGLLQGDTFDLHDQHIAPLVESPTDDVHIESLVLGGRGGVRACTGIPLYRGDGTLHGRLCALYATAHHPTSAELTLLRLAGRIVMDALDALQRQERDAEFWKHQALHDSLTGLPNRALLRDRLQQAITKCQRDNTPLAVLLMDLDGFKSVNDTHGHTIGDELLAQIGPRIQHLLRESDTVARLGGDEFVVLLQGVDADGAVLVARKILHSQRRPFRVAGHRLTVWSSIGIAVYPEDGDEGDALLRSADDAMYVAKQHEGGFAVLPRGPAPSRREQVRTLHARRS